MRRSGWTPSIVPNGNDQTVYIVLDDFGRIGRATAAGAGTPCGREPAECEAPRLPEGSIDLEDKGRRTDEI